jgi:hypothetical protein
MDRFRFSFPDTVDEVSARLVATGVVAQGALFALTRSPLLLATLLFGFAARVGWGPRFSPLALTVTRVIRPRLSLAERTVAGAPKRFAQGIGLAFSAASLAFFALGNTTAAVLVIAALVGAASLEAFAGFCLGCVIFRTLMRAGVIPESVCASCSDISERLAERSAALRSQTAA